MREQAHGSYSELKRRVHGIMRGEGTAGQVVDAFIVICIVLSLFAIMLETLPEVSEGYGAALDIFEILITAIFTVEYAVRIWSSNHRVKHFFRPLYLIDLVAILPFYLTLLFPPGTVDFVFIRAIRIVRIFRVLKLTRYVVVVEGIKHVIATKKAELGSVVVLSLIFLFVMASLEYYAEPQTFGNIPNAIWWALVTLATVGYGDVRPETALGKLVASGIIYMSVAFIAIPTAIIGSALTNYYFKPETSTCGKCGNSNNPKDARFCYRCGKRI